MAQEQIQAQKKETKLQLNALEQKRMILEEKRQQQNLSIENQKAELDKLRAQINPHFIFNSLNFFYAEIRPNSPKTAESILLLSDILRYTLIEHKDDDLVDLAKEIEHIENYLTFQRNRFDGNIQLKFEKSWSENVGKVKIPSMILLTLVENCFKYGDLKNLDHPCLIEARITQKSFTFTTQNLILIPVPRVISTKIGENNIKNRLELLYSHNGYQFNSYAQNGHYHTELVILL